MSVFSILVRSLKPGFLVSIFLVFSLSCSDVGSEKSTGDEASVVKEVSSMVGEEMNVSVVKIKFSKKDLGRSKKLKGTGLGLNDVISFPKRLLLKGDILVITDKNPESMVNLINLTNGKPDRKLGVKGYGPNEMMSTWTIDEGMSDEGFWVFDLQQRKFNFFELNAGDGLSQKQMKFENDLFSCLEPLWASDSVIVGLNYDGLAKFSKFDTSGNVLKRYGDWESMVQGKYSLNVISQLFQGRLHTGKEKNYFMLNCIYLDHLEILDLKNNHIIEISGPLQIEPAFSEERVQEYQVFAPDPVDTHYGYLDGFVGENAFYALFSGQKWNGNPSGKEACSEIYVFDLNGKPISHFELDRAITSFTISEENKVIYGVTFEADPDVVAFNFGI